MDFKNRWGKMINKQIIKPRPICLYEDTCLHLKEKTRLCEDCVHHKNYWSELLEKEQVEKIKSLEQECEELRQYHNKCCEEFKKEKQDLIDKYNQLSINFYNGDYCNTEYCSLLKSKEKECERLEQTLIQIKDIAENVQSFVGRIDIEDDVFEQMEQILKKISEMNHDL